MTIAAYCRVSSRAQDLSTQRHAIERAAKARGDVITVWRSENVPLNEDIHAYFEREVKPHRPDAWIDESKTKIGYEIPFTREFYRYVPLRPLTAIDTDMRRLENEIQSAMAEVMR